MKMTKFNDVIIVLGGGPKQDSKGVWRTSNLDESVALNGAGDRLRVEAAALLFAENPKLLIIASGGRGELRKVSGAPAISEIVKRDLKELGVAESNIEEENQSNNTYEQLQALKNLLSERGWRVVKIISNEYHLPRVQAFIESDSELKSWHAAGKIVLGSAEEILISRQPERWKEKITRAYASPAMKTRVASEQKGISAIKSGKYKLNS